MCGRSRNTLNRQQVAAAARVAPERWRNADSFQPSYNLPPGRDAPVVKRAEDGQLEVQTMRWGLVPSWTKKGTKPDHFRMFNARSETVAEKSVFSRLLSRQRCIFLAEGFYEWKKVGSKKQPYYIHMGEERPLQMAGLYDVWHNEDGNALHTFTLLTTDSSKRLRWLHDRMPVLLTTPEAQGAWLAQEINLKGLTALAVPYTGEDLVWHEVTPQMGSPQFQGPDCCKPLKKGPGIAAFFKKPTAGKPAAAAEAAMPSPAAATAGKGGADAAAADTAAPDEAAVGVKLEDGATAAQPGSGRQDGSSDACPAPAVNAEQASLPDGRTDGAAAPAGSIEQKAGAAAPGRQPGSERPGAGTGGLVKQEDDAQQPAVEAAHPDDAGSAPALPLNPDDNAGEVKQEEEQQHSQPAAADAPQPPPPASTRKKRPAGADASAAKSPGDSKRPKKDTTPAKGQKTMNAFFAVK